MLPPQQLLKALPGVFEAKQLPVREGAKKLTVSAGWLPECLVSTAPCFSAGMPLAIETVCNAWPSAQSQV